MGHPAMAMVWRIILWPVLESVLNNHAQHHRVPRPILRFHGPRGVGKTSLLHRLLPAWNTSPHLAAYVDFASDDSVSAVASDCSTAIATTAAPWGAFACLSSPPALDTRRARLEHTLESLVDTGSALAPSAAAMFSPSSTSGTAFTLPSTASLAMALASPLGGRHEFVATLWAKAVLTFTARVGPGELDAAKAAQRRYSMEEATYVREARVALRLVKEVIGMH